MRLVPILAIALATGGCFRCAPPLEDPTCGNERVDPGEDCDGALLGSSSCFLRGAGTSGSLACTPACTYDTSGCWTCGDGAVTGAEEACDLSDLGGASCTALGFDGGALTCTESCALDDSECTVCGDGVIEGAEACEPGDLGGQTCWTVPGGFDLGSLSCAESCDFDTSGCVTLPPYPAGDRDLNGDGYPDMVIGGQEGAGDAGIANVYFGGPAGIDPSPVAVIVGAAGDNLGAFAALPGDVNGDGFADLLVSAPQYAGMGQRRVDLFLGGPGAMFDTAADVSFVDTVAFEFGLVIGGAGDLDGDGYADFYMGPSGAPGGSVDIHHGGAVLDSTPDVVLTGLLATEAFGFPAGSGGDANGDGVLDFVVGGAETFPGTGSLYVFFGAAGAPLDPVPDLVIAGLYPSFEFAGSPGDVDGDGWDDLAVTDVSTVPFVVDIFLGGPLLDATADVSLASTATYDAFGRIAPAGDLNGDGISDLLIGAAFSALNGIDSGAVLVYYGESLETGPHGILIGAGTNHYFGYSLGLAGDVNGDGFGDIVVGSFGSDLGGTNSGRADVFYGGPEAAFDTVPDVTFTGMVGDSFGTGVARALR